MKKILIFLMAIGFLLIGNCHAGYLPNNWSNSIDSDKNINLQVKQGDGVDQVYSYFTDTIIPITKSVILLIAIIYASILVFGLAISRGEEDVVKGFSKKIGWIILGLALISISGQVGEIFDPLRGNNAQDIGDYVGFSSLADVIINSATIIIGGIAVLMLVISGLQIVVAGGDLKTDEHKRNFVYSLSGIIIILVIRKFIRDIFYLNYGLSGPNEAAVTSASSELFGVFSYAMQFLALGCVGIIILGGVYYIFSLGDDKIGGQVKIIVKNVIIGLLIIMTAFTLVATFIPH